MGRMDPRWVLVVVCVLIIVMVAVPRFQTGLNDIECADCNVLYISIDPLAAHHMGVYGYGRNTTPHIDRLANSSFVFDRAFTQSSHTLPAMYSTIASLYPSQHGMFPGTLDAGEPSFLTVSEVMKSAGYRTFSVNGGANVGASLGFDRGFSVYREAVSTNKSDRTLKEQYNFLVRSMKERDDTNFFAVFQTFSTHDPYFPPMPYKNMFIDILPPFHREANETWQAMIDRYGASDQLYTNFRPFYFGRAAQNPDVRHYIVTQYDGEVRRIDDLVGDIIAQLKRRQLYNKTIIIINSQHGEQFYEHGEWRHETTLYNEVIRVPMIIHLPGQTHGRRIGAYVENIDIAPTLLDLVDIRTEYRQQFNQQAEGISLVPIMRGRPSSKQFILSEGMSGDMAFIDPDIKIKYYQKNETHTLFFDLRKDFGEQHLLPDTSNIGVKEQFDDIYRGISSWESSSNATWPYLVG